MDTVRTWIKDNGKRWCLSLLRTFVSTFIGTLVFMLNTTSSFSLEIIETLLIASLVSAISAVLKGILEVLNSYKVINNEQNTASSNEVTSEQGGETR